MKRIYVCLVVGLIFVGPASAQHASWSDNVNLKGDLRYRYELIDEEGKDQRYRNRIRARIGIQAEVNQMTRIGLQFASGPDDPVSTNQTLGNGFSTKSLMLDLAYLRISPPSIPDLTIMGGKFNNPLFRPAKSELVWDSDLNPEGGAVTYKRGYERVSVTLNGGAFLIEERPSDDDSWIAAGQGIVSYQLNEKKYGFALGGSFFKYFNTVGYKPFFNSDNPMGNTVDSLGFYANKYQLVELLAEGTHHFGSIPVVLFGDLAVNTSADSLSTGWLVGLLLGKTKNPGSWDVRYIYREVEQDAVIGAFTDSDFLGGGTGGKGHEIGGAFQIAQNSAIEWTYFANTIGLTGEGTDCNRLQVDLQLKF